MTISFAKDAAEINEKKARDAEASGNFDSAAKKYKAAAKYYSELAEMDVSNYPIWDSKAATCRSKAELLIIQQSATIDTNPASAVGTSNASNSAPTPAPSSSGPSNTAGNQTPSKPTPSHTPAPSGQADGNVDYSKYNLDISKPNNSMMFDDLIGLEEAKEAVRQMLVEPLKDPESYKKYRLKIGGFLLLWGPAGTGKTSFAQAVANELGFAFVATNANDFVNSYIGQTGKNIKALFDNVRAFIENEGLPVILFIDEFDAICRKSDGNDRTSDEALPTLKQQMEGFDTPNEKLFIIAATNYRDRLDNSIINRFTCIEVPKPSKEAREVIFKSKCKKTDMSPEDFEQLDFAEIAKRTEGFAGRDIAAVLDSFFRRLVDRDTGRIQLDHPMTAMLDIIEQRRKQID